MTLTKRVALLGVFSALSIVLSTLEGFVPLQALIHLPGIKIGIANIVTLILLYHLSVGDAVCVLAVRCTVCAVLFGTPVSFLMSFTGGMCALAGMYAARRYGRFFSRWGVSVIGAALHNVGQTVAAAIWMKNAYIFAYLPTLLFVSLLTGTIVGILFILTEKKLPKSL